MNFTHEVEQMCCVAKGPKHGPAPIPQEGAWTKAYEIKDISGLTHGVGWCAPQQGACKLTLNVKNGIIEEALVETIGCSGMTHSAAMAAEILPGKTILEALNTDLVCDAINTAMRELFLQIVYGRTQTAFSEGGLPIGAGLKTSERDFVPLPGRCTEQVRKACATLKWRKAMSPKSHWTMKTKSSATSSSSSDPCSTRSTRAWTRTKLSRSSPEPTDASLTPLKPLTRVISKRSRYNGTF